MTTQNKFIKIIIFAIRFLLSAIVLQKNSLNNIFLDFFSIGHRTKPIYHILNVKIEKMCDLIHLVFVDGSLVGLLLPAFLTTVVNFSHGLKEKSFILPIPVM